jgi:hypothetical protein
MGVREFEEYEDVEKYGERGEMLSMYSTLL